jgi:Fic family protein
MQRFQSVYGGSEILATNEIIALAAAHHRLAWIHPFGDGNGRVARLHSQAAMIRSGLDGEGLWTLSRGLARKKSVYFRHLQETDQNRKNDFDGRGNLSDSALASFCTFFLEQILDQIDFMIRMIEPFKLQERIANYFRFIRMDLDPKTRELFTRLIQELSIKGELPRGAIPDVLGLKQTMTRELIRKALDENLIYSDSEKRPLKIAFPNNVVEYYFPSLFTDLPVDPY